MGDSGSDTSAAEEEQGIAGELTQEDVTTQPSRSNIVDSSSYDAQFTADNLEARGLPPENFMSAANFAQTTQGGASGDDSPSVNVPSIEAASSTLAPGILGETLSDFQSGLRPITGEEDTPANQMLEAAIASRPRDFSNLDLIPTTGFLPAQVTVSDKTSPGTQAAIAATLSQLDQATNRKVGLGDERGIDFGVTQQLLPTAPPPRPVDRMAAMTMPGTAMGTTTNEVTDADTTAASEILAGLFDKDPDSIAARSMPGTAVDLTEGTGTTATGTTRGEDPFDPDVGRAFPVETLERAERLVNEKTALENLGLPSFLSAVDPERVSRDLMATSLIAGRPIGAVEAIRGVQAPNIGMGPTKATDKETIEEFNKRTGARIPESQIITDDSGLVVGIKDAQGNLVTGMDPNAQEVQGDGGEQVRRAPPKAPTDPCPDGYQLIDGKCTPTGATDTGTGFMMFPADRDPAFRRGPFTPTTVATTPNIRALNPVTFGLSNIFRR